METALRYENSPVGRVKTTLRVVSVYSLHEYTKRSGGLSSATPQLYHLEKN